MTPNLLDELENVMQLDGPDGRFDAACIAALRFLRTHHATLADMAKRMEAAERDARRKLYLDRYSE